MDALSSNKAGPSCAPYTKHQSCYVDILNAMVTPYSIEELINSDHAINIRLMNKCSIYHIFISVQYIYSKNQKGW